MIKRKSSKIIVILFLMMIAGVSIVFYLYNPKKAINLILPDLSHITYINAAVKNDSVRTKIDVVVQNKSPYKLSIDSVYFEIKLNNEQLLEELVYINLKQQRYRADTLELPVDISRKKLKAILENLKGRDSTNLNVNCFVKYNTIFGRVKLKYDKVIRISVPIPPQIKVIKVERKKYSLTEKTLFTNIQLEIINRGKNINLELSDIHYQMNIENSLNTEGVIDRRVSIKPQSTQIIEIPVEIKVEHPIKTIMAIITDNDKMNYTLHLQAIMTENMVDKVKQDPIPIEINASGKLELKK